MDFQVINPRTFPDWDAILLHSRDYEFFHTSGWARALEETYGFKPAYRVQFQGNEITLLMPLMEMQSLFSGTRAVSLPFTDYCPPHNGQGKSYQDILESTILYGKRVKWRYIEWRDGGYFHGGTPHWDTYYSHEIDLKSSEKALFSALSDNNRRNIRKSIREGVCISTSQSLDSINEFYRLNLLTRKRHGLPPQPYLFFKNVHKYIISNGNGFIVLASHKKQTIAASIFFHFGAKALFKYNASDLRSQHLRPNNLILWEALKWYRDRGFLMMSLGRSEITDLGLLRYKRTWGGKETSIVYYRYDLRKMAYLRKKDGHMDRINKILSHFPIPILRILGTLFYKYAS